MRENKKIKKKQNKKKTKNRKLGIEYAQRREEKQKDVCVLCVVGCGAVCESS
jgi:hypothetical protein